MYKNKEFYARLGRALKSERRLRRISANDIAQKIGVTHQQLRKYESGENRIPVDKFDMYCTEIDINPRSLIDWSKKKNLQIALYQD